MGSVVADIDELSGGGDPDEVSAAELVECPSGVGFQSVGSSGEWAEVAGAGLVFPACPVGVGVIQVEVSRFGVGPGEHVVGVS